MRILLLTHYYPPEVGAPQPRLRETARGLIDLGNQVRILTGPPHYPHWVVRTGYAWWRFTRELQDGVVVSRLPRLSRPNGRIADRIVDPASCVVVAFGVGGIPEAVGDPSLGVLVRPGGTDGLVTALSRLCDAPAVAASIGKAASERVLEHYALGSRLPLIPQANGMEMGPVPDTSDRPAEDRDD